jgi:hypothetical protein
MILEGWVGAIKINEPVSSFLERDQAILAFPQDLKSGRSIWDDSFYFKRGTKREFSLRCENVELNECRPPNPKWRKYKSDCSTRFGDIARLIVACLAKYA